MKGLYSVSGPVTSLSIETADVVKSGLSWKEREKKKHSHILYNGRGDISEKHTSEEITHYIYNETGSLMQESHFYNNKELVYQEIFHYNENGELTEAETVDPSGTPMEKKVYQMDSERLLTVIRSREGTLVQKFNHSGLLISEQTYKNEELFQQIDYQYTPRGQISLIEHRNGEGEVLRTTRLQYNEKDLLKEEKCITQENIIVFHEIYEYSHFFNENWMRCIRYTVSEDNRKIQEIPVEIYYRSMTFAETTSEVTPPREEEGTLKFPNGIYRGSIVNGQMHGTGRFEFVNGSTYEGEFSQGIIQGKGTFTWPGGRCYTGGFSEGKMEGKGHCRWSNGDEYKGEFHKGLMHGIGVFTWKNGDRFYGLFQQNKRSDQGLFEPGGIHND